MSANPRTVDLIVTNVGELLTCAAGAPDLVGLASGQVAVDDGVIVAVGDTNGLTARTTVDARQGVVMPGFVDAHTHVVFAGTRVDEYAARLAGRQPPSGVPVGIVGTTEATRGCPLEDLVAQADARVGEMVASGTTTLESKSGYGLEPATERRLLEANARLDRRADVEVCSTYLGAHAFPRDLGPEEYVATVVDQVAEVAELGLAEFCDVYCDEGYFTLDQTRRILEAGLAHGLRPKVHLDAYSRTGAAALAAELGAVSVDHLNHTSPDDVLRLADAGVVGVYMPCLDYLVGHSAPVDARALADAGLEIALATDVCPGCWTTSMQLVVAMACRSGGLSVAEALRAATYGAARSMGREDRIGSLEVGKQADLVVLDVPRHEDIAYRFGRSSVTTVVKAGRVVKEPA